MKTDEPNAPITHPWSLLGMFLLGLNDHYLKWEHPSYLTGKLSDVAAMLFFPLLLEYALRSRVLSVAVTAVAFALIKTTVFGNDLYNAVYGWLYDLLGWGPLTPLVMDPEDCLALIALYVPLRMIPRRRKEGFPAQPLGESGR